MRISDWSSDVCSSDLRQRRSAGEGADDLGDATHPGVGRLRVHHGTRSALIGRRLLAAAEESAQERRGLGAVAAAALAPLVGWDVTEPLLYVVAVPCTGCTVALG